MIPETCGPEDQDYYHHVAQRIARETPGAFLSDQFNNPSNPAIHYATTGHEIWEDTAGEVGVYVAGVGTSGVLTGTARYLKERNPGVRIVAVDPEGSAYSGGPTHPYKVVGIGGDMVSTLFYVAGYPELSLYR